MNLWRNVRRRNHDLTHVSRLVVQVPRPHAAEVTPVCLFRLLVELLQDVVDMVPVLHLQGIRMVDDHDFNR